jgi:3-oxoadipate enol-lactonase
MQARVNDISLSYDDMSHGEPVLLVHAFPFNRRMWALQVAALTAAGYRVIAPDLRGFGQSDAPPGPYPLDQLADDLVALLDALDVQQVVLVGLSMGGYIAFHLLRRASERVRALVLADTRATADSAEAAATRLERAALAELEGAAPVVTAMLPGMLAGGQLDEADPALVEHIRTLMLSASPAGVAGALRGMASRPDAGPDLPSFNAALLDFLKRDA